MTIPIITRTNTIDEWRIQTNLSAEKLNDLEFGNFDKSNGTLTISNTTTLIITAEGTPLQVSNSALIQKDLSIGANTTIGTVGTRNGNLVVGNTVTVAGQGIGLYVSNTAQIGRNLSVVGTIYGNNAIINTNATVAGDVQVDGVVTLSGSGKVLDANSGIVYVQDAYLTNAVLQKANVDTIYALEAYIDNLQDIASAVVGILRVSTGNVYTLSSNELYANSGTIQTFVANGTGNVVTLTSNVATINTSYITNLEATGAIVTNGNVATLIVDNGTINTATIIDSTTTNSSISNAVITGASITTETVGTSTVTNGTIITGNVVTLTSNVSTLNNSTLLSSNIVSANITNANVSGNLNFVSGSTLRINSGSGNDALVVDSGLTSLQGLVVEGNLTVSGSFTQTGNINFETDRFIFNANTGVNKDALIVNERVSGNDAQILWNETNDRWEISTGNTYSSTYKILDGADIYTGVDSTSTTLVASASAVKFAYEAGGVVAGGYANAAYRHANSAHTVANSASSYANGAFVKSNTANLTAQAAFDAANNAFVAGGTIAGSYANSAYIHANAAFSNVNTTIAIVGSYANSAYTQANASNSFATNVRIHANAAFTTANLAVVNAELADIKAVNANTKAQAAFDKANLASSNASSASSYANGSFAQANLAFSGLSSKLSTSGGTISGDLVVTGAFTTSGASILANELKVADALITLNSDIPQNQSPSENAGLEVDRGTAANAYLQWNETSDVWEFGTSGSVQTIVGASTLASQLSSYLLLSGGTMTGAITLSGAPTQSLHAATKAYVDQQVSGSTPDLSNLNATNLTSGTVPSARLSGTYAISISGQAATVADGSVGSAQLKTVQTLRILDSSGVTLKTIYGAGS